MRLYNGKYDNLYQNRPEYSYFYIYKYEYGDIKIFISPYSYLYKYLRGTFGVYSAYLGSFRKYFLCIPIYATHRTPFSLERIS